MRNLGAFHLQSLMRVFSFSRDIKTSHLSSPKMQKMSHNTNPLFNMLITE